MIYDNSMFQSYVAPLANMLPEKYKGKNVKDFYPEFRKPK